MKKPLLLYAATAAVMLVLDALWLGLVATQLYSQGIGHLMAAEPRLGVAALFYLLYPVGLVVFAVGPSTGWRNAAWKGALFGFFAYATYDLTNLATLKDWPVWLAALDIAWGTLVSGVSAAAGGVAKERLARR
ncbi:MAG: membrane protein [Methylibium sp. NZG]|nr:MAG: membrane protein [Methylibium sp. NZG]